MTTDDIYTGMMALMVRIEDTLRANNCSIAIVNSAPITISPLYNQALTSLNLTSLTENPDTDYFLTSVAPQAKQMIANASKCTVDWVGVTRVMATALRHMANRVACSSVEKDILMNRANWASVAEPVKPSTPNSTGIGNNSIGSGYALKTDKIRFSRLNRSNPYYPDGIISYSTYRNATEFGFSPGLINWGALRRGNYLPSRHHCDFSSVGRAYD